MVDFIPNYETISDNGAAEGTEQLMERHNEAQGAYFRGLCMCKRAQLMQSMSNCQTKLSKDAEQSDGKPHVPEIT